ncbi:MAG: Cobalt-zinc-cadmium resistance protein CzcD [uncultured Gemmatimonadetes bacterium]|uniref:Cobalt-zinc-cadmium resistance protein CzcD n=1 Tax=uncultured Gemmatimonadota bacterium TaxID=203437 RepID=A0A6J4MA29_9BACT|nr:MAG: Cobalt-zinc-cadmium resistance protein CzcD [uncultured Gemmatimonadota bacterium]
MGAGHHHGHGHAHGAHGNRRRLGVVLVLAAVYMVAEAVGGYLAGSLALLADAGHMLSDVGALALSLFAVWIAHRPATPQRTYGYHRTEILAALANGATLIAISLFIFVEAFQRLREPQPVQGALVMWIAAGGLAVNLVGMWVLHGGRGDNLNIRGAWLHMLTDALGSVGALAGGAAVWAFGWYWADPAVSVLIGALVIYASWGLLRESVAVLLEGTPSHIDLHEVRAAMVQVDGVEAVHDLHVWTITSGMEAMSGHVVVGDSRRDDILAELHRLLHDRFGLHHLTIQLEPRGFQESGCITAGC